MITVQVDDSTAQAFLESAGDQFPFAGMVAINRTAEEALAATHPVILANLLVRRPGFILPPRILPREWRATKENPTATIAIGDGGSKKLGDRRRAILEKFEEGGVKTGSERLPIAIPTKWVRPSPQAEIPRQMYPKYLVGRFTSKGELVGLDRKARTRLGRRQGRGRMVGRFFVIGRPGDRNWGLYERLGSREIIMLWAFRKQIPIPARLHWEETAMQTIDQRIVPNMNGAIELAIRTARAASGRSVGRALLRSL